jgi:hypothetical protein
MHRTVMAIACWDQRGEAECAADGGTWDTVGAPDGAGAVVSVRARIEKALRASKGGRVEHRALVSIAAALSGEVRIVGSDVLRQEAERGDWGTLARIAEYAVVENVARRLGTDHSGHARIEISAGGGALTARYYEHWPDAQHDNDWDTLATAAAEASALSIGDTAVAYLAAFAVEVVSALAPPGGKAIVDRVSATFHRGPSPRAKAVIFRTKTYPYGKRTTPDASHDDALVASFGRLFGERGSPVRRTTEKPEPQALKSGYKLYAVPGSASSEHTCAGSSVCASSRTEGLLVSMWTAQDTVVACTKRTADMVRCRLRAATVMAEVMGRPRTEARRRPPMGDGEHKGDRSAPSKRAVWFEDQKRRLSADLAALEQNAECAAVYAITAAHAVFVAETFADIDGDRIDYAEGWRLFGLPPYDHAAYAIAARSVYNVVAIATPSKKAPSRAQPGSGSVSGSAGLADQVLVFPAPLRDDAVMEIVSMCRDRAGVWAFRLIEKENKSKRKTKATPRSGSPWVGQPADDATADPTTDVCVHATEGDVWDTMSDFCASFV